MATNQPASGVAHGVWRAARLQRGMRMRLVERQPDEQTSAWSSLQQVSSADVRHRRPLRPATPAPPVNASPGAGGNRYSVT